MTGGKRKKRTTAQRERARRKQNKRGGFREHTPSEVEVEHKEERGVFWLSWRRIFSKPESRGILRGRHGQKPKGARSRG